MAVWDGLMKDRASGPGFPAPSGTGDGTGGAGPGGYADAAPVQSPSLRSLSQQTKKAMTVLLLIAALGLVLIAFLALKRDNGMHFLTWAAIAASCAMVAGGALGLLFGLPTATATTVITTNPIVSTAPAATGSTPPAAPLPAEGGPTAEAPEPPPPAPLPPPPPPDTVDLGYRDSTSLEQVADWLTKIIIGLSLTQWNSWEDKFTHLATNLTITLLGQPTGGQPQADFAVPGGILLGLYAIIGFLASYLWMRRYFILEMVTARREAREAMARQFEENQRRQKQRTKQVALNTLVAAARARGLAPAAAPAQGATHDLLNDTLNQGVGLLPPGSAGTRTLDQVMSAIAGSAPDPMDPWRGQFGGAESVNGVSLSATVTATSDPSLFRIELAVRATNPQQTQALNGSKAVYFLHPTFGPAPRVSSFGSDGRAPLELYAWGAFTVGVVLEDGTALELNLATLPGAPDLFRMR